MRKRGFDETCIMIFFYYVTHHDFTSLFMMTAKEIVSKGKFRSLFNVLRLDSGTPDDN